MKNLLRGILVVVILTIVLVLFIYSGIYNISTTSPHYKFTRWVISKVTDNSIKHHAIEIAEPPYLTDSSLIKTGFVHYKEMCLGCHGAPGINRNEVSEGFYPKPPRLLKSAKEWKPAELFWIVKNGIKMTGMPGFGISHKDDKIWAIVAFMEKLPYMTPEQYKSMENSLIKEKND